MDLPPSPRPPSLPKKDEKWDRKTDGGLENDKQKKEDEMVRKFDEMLRRSGESNGSEYSKFAQWSQSFRRTDPRFEILKFFHDVEQRGVKNIEEVGFDAEPTHKTLRFFDKVSVFTVWRPTSADAIRKMMCHEGVGKGLDIKGKSAKKGKLSGFVPFLQIYKEQHKHMIRSLPKEARMRIFYPTKEARNIVIDTLTPIAKEMMKTVSEAKLFSVGDVLVDSFDKKCLDCIQKWDMADPSIKLLEDCAPNCYGIELAERLFWEGYVMRQNCGRDSDNETGRPSEPAFQDMNFTSLRQPPKENAPRAVVWQFADPENPMSPQDLLMAYEENGKVSPVVSDFDCFLVGTRRVSFESNLPEDQVELLNWSISQIESILESSVSEKSWTSQWLGVLKKEALKGFHPEMPQFGFGDPKSYNIMKYGAGRLDETGAVRHGAECFNYYFPQELDEQFLIICNNLPGKLPWKYVNARELQGFLHGKIDEGFTFPLNPKWVLCDHGWKCVYDRLIRSESPSVQKSMNIWYPRESGIREKIDAIHSRHPLGFIRKESIIEERRHSGTTAMDLAQMELNNFLILHRAKIKIRATLMFLNYRCEGKKKQRIPQLSQDPKI
mmetsp:Transcript_15220/g.22426  ORF Transcript_15220/g.22426 Transcript_15220/m.22426 type:complete len:607 (+) Transcript_15220:125-1945(+)